MTQQNQPRVDGLKKDQLREKFERFIRRMKLLLSGKQDEKTLNVSVGVPIGTIIICSVIFLFNVWFITTYIMAKNADIALLKKIDTVWSSVVASKQQIGDLNKLQKDSAPSVALYKPIIRVIIASGVDYSQIKPSETSLSLEIKGAPETIMGLFSALKEKNITFSRTSLSYQTATKADGSVDSNVSTSLTITP